MRCARACARSCDRVIGGQSRRSGSGSMRHGNGQHARAMPLLELELGGDPQLVTLALCPVLAALPWLALLCWAMAVQL